MGEKTVVLCAGLGERMAARMRAAAEASGAFRLVEAAEESEAISILPDMAPAVVVVSLAQGRGTALTVADRAGFRLDHARVLVELGEGPDFADGSIFLHMPNAHGVVSAEMAPGDLAAFVQHHAEAAARGGLRAGAGGQSNILVT
ncbi:hypothetical protein [Jannaschia sp. W003]|uniref:hypothetical protein n=1 Tax=Jannaschia sp. W003 TaxID=2867012 RepID=UPI0021A3834E|nr:hypothetical protein [Jannaschia sp. W003]UWQ22552.1 hypothetical protein K3554_05880 [Jannaschia sp. W003]